ncbi:hypothetical protein C6497_04955 [Candidatus Poribacteria bacterium]|nr:MAG: hypothetical protein C6497_04955 [Candidatus Poribacteria bacterium]
MEIFWLFIRWIHVLAAVTWIGGNLTLAMIIVPYFRQNLPPVKRILLLTEIGKRFEPIVWGCVFILLFTGIGNVFESLGLSDIEVNAYMRTLLIKLILFIILIILTAMHSFVFGPKLSSAIEGLDEELETLPTDVDAIRKRLAFVSSLMGVVSLLVLLAAVALRMGI